MDAGLKELARDRVMQRSRRRDADRVDAAQQLAMVHKSGDAELGPQALARVGRWVGDADELAVRERGVFLCVEAAEVAGADDGAAQSRHVGASIAARARGLPRPGLRRTLSAMAWHDPIRNWYAGSRPPGGASLRIAALWLGFGLVVMPFLIYLAGFLTLGPYEGGLLAFLGSLLAASSR